MSAKIGRNDPCPCGAKRPNGLPMRYKNCCMRKVPREVGILVAEDNDSEDPIVGLVWNDKEFFVEKKSGIVKRPDHALFMLSRKKMSGDNKVLTLLHNPTIFSFQLEANLAVYERIFAVDTNTKDGVSVSCVVEAKAIRVRNDLLEVRYCRSFCILFRNANDPEKHAWCKLINWLIAHPRYRKEQRFCIVTDHEVAKHEKYNSRELPVFEEYLLPENVEFHYASDASADSTFNTLIRESDQYARTILNDLLDKGSASIGGRVVSIEQIPHLKAAKE